MMEMMVYQSPAQTFFFKPIWDIINNNGWHSYGIYHGRIIPLSIFAPNASPGGGAKQLPVRPRLDLLHGAPESAARDVGGRLLAVQGAPGHGAWEI